MTAASAIYLALLVIGITLLVIYARSSRLLKCVIFTLTTGFIALGAVLLLSKFTSLTIAVTPLSMLFSGLLGIPGVICMLILNLI